MPRDYKKERLQPNKLNKKLIGVEVKKEIFEDFTAKCELQGTSKNAFLKECIDAFTYGTLTGKDLEKFLEKKNSPDSSV